MAWGFSCMLGCKSCHFRLDLSSETSLLYGWTHIPSTNWSSGGRRPTYWGCGGGSPRREAEGRLMANVPPLGKTFFRKSTKNSGMSIFGSKTKVVCAEILHILVCIPSRGDPYLIVSRTVNLFVKSPHSKVEWPSPAAQVPPLFAGF